MQSEVLAKNNVAKAQPVRKDAEFLPVVGALINFSEELNQATHPQVSTFLSDNAKYRIVELHDNTSPVMKSIHKVFLEPYRWVTSPFWGATLTSFFNSHYPILLDLWLRTNVIFKYLNDKIIHLTERTAIEHLLKNTIESRLRDILQIVPPDMQSPPILKTELRDQNSQNERLEITFGMNMCNLSFNNNPNFNQDFLKLLEYKSNEQLRADNRKLSAENNANIQSLEDERKHAEQLQADLSVVKLNNENQSTQITELGRKLRLLTETVDQLQRITKDKDKDQNRQAEAGLKEIDKTLNKSPRLNKKMAAGGGDDDA